MICFYHNDEDGHCAGAIVKRYVRETFPDVVLRFMEVDYAYDNYEEKALDFVKRYNTELVFIVDFHFSAEVVKEMCEYAKTIYVFDHHKSAADTIAQYPEEVICHCDPGSKLAGCELTWEYLFPMDAMPLAVVLIGDRDKWAWVHGEKTAKFTEGLHLHPNYPEDEIWNELLDDEGNRNTIENILHDGEICLKYRDNKFKGFRDAWGYETSLAIPDMGRYSCYVINIMFHDAVGEMFGEKINEYDVCAATVFKDGLWKISLRTARDNVDVSKICQKVGGGGHAGAAGAENLKELPFGLGGITNETRI